MVGNSLLLLRFIVHLFANYRSDFVVCLISIVFAIFLSVLYYYYYYYHYYYYIYLFHIEDVCDD